MLKPVKNKLKILTQKKTPFHLATRKHKEKNKIS